MNIAAALGGTDEDTEQGRLEDQEIQCSLPFYLEHLFGGSVNIRNTQTRDTCSPPPSAPILNSQGFLTTRKSLREPSVNILPGVGSRSPSGLISLSALPCVDEEESGEEYLEPAHSPILFPSPDKQRGSNVMPNSESNTVTSTLNTPKASSKGVLLQEISDICELTNIAGVSNTQTEMLNKNIIFEQPKEDGQSKDVSVLKCISPKSERTKRGRKRQLSPSPVKEKYSCPPMATCLKDCALKQGTVSVLALVVQVHPVMDVSCRVGDKAGQTVPMSSLLLADPTKSYFKLSLWRQAAVWVERISAGDIIYFRKIRLKEWRGEVVATTTMFSSVLNLHQPKRSLPPQVSSEIPERSLELLTQWAKKFFGYLFQSSVSKSHKMAEFVSSNEFSSHSIIHFRARLLSMITEKVLVISDVPDKEFCLYLVGGAVSLWSSQLRGGLGRVCEFTYLATSPSTLTQGGCTLHTTSNSQLRVLDNDCPMSIELLKLFPREGGLVTRGLSIADMLLNKSSGVYLLKARAKKIEFIDGANLTLESLCELSPSTMVQKLCQNCIYVGCGSCSNPLTQDENGVYRQCLPCLLARTRDQQPGFQYYYRVLAITLRDESGSSVIMVTQSVSPKVIGYKPLDIVHVSLSKNEEKMSEMQKALYHRVSCLGSCEGIWTVSLGVAKDENSFVHSIATSLLDWSCDNHVTI